MFIFRGFVDKSSLGCGLLNSIFMSGAFLSIVNANHSAVMKPSIFCKKQKQKKKSAYACFLRKKTKIKWLSRPVWDCNALRGLTYTGNVLDWHSLYSLNCLMPLKFCNQNKSFEKI